MNPKKTLNLLLSQWTGQADASENFASLDVPQELKDRALNKAEAYRECLEQLKAILPFYID